MSEVSKVLEKQFAKTFGEGVVAGLEAAIKYIEQLPSGAASEAIKELIAKQQERNAVQS